MDNGIVKATINKRNSHMTSLVYHGVDIMGPGGIWEQTPSGQVTQSITIDPATNGGERGEVAMKGVNGRMDIEVRYALERGDSGIYTYADFLPPGQLSCRGRGRKPLHPADEPDLRLALGRRRPQHARCATTRTWARASSSTPRNSASSTPASTRIPSSTNTATTPCSTSFPPTAGRAPRTTSASGSSTPPSNTSAAAPRNWIWSATWAATAPRLLDLRPLRRRRRLQHPRRRKLEQGHRPDLRLLQRAGRSQGSVAGRSRHARRHRRQSHRAGGMEGQCHRALAGCTGPGQRRKGAVALRLGQRRGLSAQGTSAATSPANSCSTTRRPPRQSCRI